MLMKSWKKIRQRKRKMPKNEGSLGAGDREMSSAARLHGEPLMRLNKLVRWYIRFGFLLFVLIPFVVVFDAFLPVFSPALGFSFHPIYSSQIIFLFLHAGVVLSAGGLAIKFLPSSMGGNPHVYSLSLSLWSFWLLIGATIAGILGIVAQFIPFAWSNRAIALSTIALQSMVLLIATVLLFYNISKTLESRI